jgi:hypothetical protein
MAFMAERGQILPAVVVGEVLAAVLDVVNVSGRHYQTTRCTHTAQRLLCQYLSAQTLPGGAVKT